MNPKSTDWKADALTTTPPRRYLADVKQRMGVTLSLEMIIFFTIVLIACA